MPHDTGYASKIKGALEAAHSLLGWHEHDPAGRTHAPDVIAERLKQAGCTGIRNDCYECPAAVWFNRALAPLLERGDEVVVTSWTAYVQRGENHDMTPIALVTFSRSVAAFVQGFDDPDDKVWPELERREVL